MTTNPAPGPADQVISHYSALARTALADNAMADCEPAASTEGCFGSAAYIREIGVPKAALRASLGCGNPLAVAGIRPGETVLDLGSGGGLDVLLSARQTGSSGIAYGLDASTDMLTLARANAAAAGITNAIFLPGCIESIPLPGSHVEVIISNGVINLSADKSRVLAEAYRVLKPGGRVGICDVISDESTDPGKIVATSHWYTAGTLTEARYRDLLQAAGFTTVSITVTSDAGNGLYSAVIQAVKPSS